MGLRLQEEGHQEGEAVKASHKRALKIVVLAIVLALVPAFKVGPASATRNPKPPCHPCKVGHPGKGKGADIPTTVYIT